MLSPNACMPATQRGTHALGMMAIVTCCLQVQWYLSTTLLPPVSVLNYNSPQEMMYPGTICTMTLSQSHWYLWRARPDLISLIMKFITPAHLKLLLSSIKDSCFQGLSGSLLRKRFSYKQWCTGWSHTMLHRNCRKLLWYSCRTPGTFERWGKSSEASTLCSVNLALWCLDDGCFVEAWL